MAALPSLCQANTSHKKTEGLLRLTRAALTWSPTNGTSKLVLDIASDRLQSLFSSKEGGAKVQLKIGCLPASSEAPLVEEFFSFVFTAASSAVSDQQHFKREVSTIVAANRERGLSGGVAGKTSEKATEGNVDGVATPIDKGKGRANGQSIFQLRRKVLVEDQALAALHAELVRSAMISEEEFWEGREGLIEATAADERQKSGRSGEMVDPRPETAANGEVTVRITPTLVREIFEEYPSVLRAYGDNVPTPLDEQQFWSRYFQSKLFNRNRTTNRAVVETIRDDAIFDLYLDEEDDELEPKNLQVEHIYRLLDLAATEDDQHEITNRADYTMRAGGQRSSLPLMRRFNEHSERLLNSSLGHQAKRPRMALDPGNAGIRNAYYDDIILEDLTTTSTQDRIILETRDRSQYTSESKKDEDEDREAKMGEEEMEEVIRNTKLEFERWEPRLNDFEIDHRAVADSMKDMTANIRGKAARADRESNSNVFPEAFLQQMTSLQASSNEFLRQFWSAVLPAKVGDVSANALATPAQKAGKAERMKGYLMKMEDRVVGLFKEADGLRLDLIRVEAALQPVRTSVAHAIEYFNSRTL